jgi:peptide deformylase
MSITTVVQPTFALKCWNNNNNKKYTRTASSTSTTTRLFRVCATVLSITMTMTVFFGAFVSTSIAAKNTAYRTTAAAFACRRPTLSSSRSTTSTTSGSYSSILSTGGLRHQHHQQQRSTGATLSSAITTTALHILPSHHNNLPSTSIGRSFSSSSSGLSDMLLRTVLFSSSSSSSTSSSSSSSIEKEEIDPGIVEGTSLRIVKYPHPALRAANTEITIEELEQASTSSELSEIESMSKLAKGMLKVMYAAEGVGLAAPQVGVNKRLMVYNPSGDPKKWLEETILINPKIVDSSDTTDSEIEGCLSFPGMNGEVIRPKWIKVEAMNLRGKKIKKKYTGWEARIFQHEYDHLDGTVYIDRLSEDTRAQVQPRLNELIAEFGDGGVV